MISQTLSYKVKVEEKWFWILNMKFSKTSPMLHFGVTKKDPGLYFHFHVSNLFKCWSKLVFDQNSNEHNKFKKHWKIAKPAHIVFLCHILTITVHKQVINTLKLYIHVSNMISQTLSYKVKGEDKWFWVSNMKISKNASILVKDIILVH